MTYQEKKTEDGFEYFNQDLYGKTTIWSKEKLTGEILDILVIDNIIAKHIKSGSINDIRFEAEFNKQWQDDDGKEAPEFKPEINLTPKTSWLKRLLKKLNIIKN